MKKSFFTSPFGQKFIAFFFSLALASGLFGQTPQAQLSLQGTLLKANGAAEDDGPKKMAFKLYTQDVGGTAIWTEVQDDVEITDGVHSVTLGKITPLTPSFTQTYYLGVTVASGSELAPRAQLTSSPYALSLRGQDNAFPSTGAVGIGTTTPTTGSELHVKDATAEAEVTVEGTTTSKLVVQSTTGSSIEFKQGANTATISYDGSYISITNLKLVLADDLVLPAGKTVSYNGLKDWRLVDVDDFETDNDGWELFTEYNDPPPYSYPTSRQVIHVPINTGYMLWENYNILTVGGRCFRKEFDLTGIPHTEVKAVFTIFCQVKRIKIHSQRESMFIEIEMDMHEKSRRDFM